VGDREGAVVKNESKKGHTKEGGKTIFCEILDLGRMDRQQKEKKKAKGQRWGTGGKDDMNSLYRIIKNQVI